MGNSFHHDLKENGRFLRHEQKINVGTNARIRIYGEIGMMRTSYGAEHDGP